jgi:predicted nucleic acid-binding protein
MRLAREEAAVPARHRLVAPTLLRSQMLAMLYTEARAGRLTKKEADGQLDYVRKLRIRLLGDRVLQSRAWTVAVQMGWPDTFMAEYVALTALQADALVTLDARLARAVRQLVPVASIDDILGVEPRRSRRA